MKNRLERYFTLSDFLNLLEGQRQSFNLLDGLHRQRWQCAGPRKVPKAMP
jgi:hypothetical protein